MKSLTMQIGIAVLLSLFVAGSAGAAVEKDKAKTSADSRRCISLTQLKELDIVDDQTILFHMSGNRVYKNRLPHRCPMMKVEDGISYSTSQNKLCSVDMVRVLRSGLRCGLGVFEPVEEEGDAEPAVDSDKEEI